MGLFMPVSLAASLVAQTTTNRWEFDAATIGQPPPGFRNTVTGQGPAGDWRVLRDPSPADAPSSAASNQPPSTIIAQLDRNPADEHFPLLLCEQHSFEDFTLSVQFMTVAGAVEQMAGLAFRVRDENNYYFVRGSSLANTFRLFRVLDGVRTPLLGVDVRIPTNTWHTLTVVCKGSEIRCLLNHRQLIPPPARNLPKNMAPPAVVDEHFRSGKIGLWTKSDSVSHFRNLEIVHQPRETLARQLVRDALRDHPRLLGVSIYSPSPSPPYAVRTTASTDPSLEGKPATPEEEACAREGKIFYGKQTGSVSVLLPLMDRNGDPLAAARITMRGFPGQTQDNALVRARPIVREMQRRLRDPRDLAE